MRCWLRRNAADDAGFTIIEVLAATILMTVILVGLATVTSQWVPNWNRGMARVQQIERLAVGLDRIAADLAAAEFIPLNNASKTPLFEGGPLSVTLVRIAIGPNAAPGLEFVRLSEKADQQGLAIVRERAPFGPMPTGTPVQFGDQVVLVRAPYRVTFSYAGGDGIWQPQWISTADLPRRVRINIRDAVSDRALVASTSVEIAVTASADCVRAKNISKCLATGQIDDVAPSAGTAVDPNTNPALNPPAQGN